MDINWKCDGCGQPLITDSKYTGAKIECPKCKKSLVAPASQTLCPSCSAELKEGSVFCAHCGFNLRTGRTVPAAVSAPASQKEWTAADMKKDLRGWGFGLIVLGVVSFVLAGFLDPVWGGLLIVIGVLALLIQRRGMFIVIGIGLLLAGIMNIIPVAGEFQVFWAIFGFLQLYWGVQEIRKFRKYAPRK